ncbi:MAG: 3'-5' exoribonuclease [Patescibacteria group bacterium]|nr:3'-5' exoribonuclease [Patescibacteria group bacterium]
MPYISIDIETDGMAAGLHSMLSLGAAVVGCEGARTFYVEMRPLPDAQVHEPTVNWWRQTNLAEWQRLHEATTLPWQAINAFADWVTSIEHTFDASAIACAWKPDFDMSFVRYYAMRFLGRQIFVPRGSGMDIKTVVAGAMRRDYGSFRLDDVPIEWFGPWRVTHNALDDARAQARILQSAWSELALGVL